MSRLFPGDSIEHWAGDFWRSLRGDYRLTDSQRQLVTLYLTDIQIGQPSANVYAKTKTLADCVERHINCAKRSKFFGPPPHFKLEETFDGPALVDWALKVGWPLTDSGPRLRERTDSSVLPACDLSDLHPPKNDLSGLVTQLTYQPPVSFSSVARQLIAH